MGDYYELLQVHAEASFEEIHRAYRSMAMRHHPDRDSTPGAAATMAALNEAYSVLSAPARRRRYDQERSKGRPPDVGASILTAAQETLLRHGWIVEENDESHLLLAQGARSVRVTFVRRLNNALLAKIGRRFAGFSVVLAVEVENAHQSLLQYRRGRLGSFAPPRRSVSRRSVPDAVCRLSRPEDVSTKCMVYGCGALA